MNAPFGMAVSPMMSSSPRQVASLTVGQTPRSDVLPDILSHMPFPVEVEEFGALDGLSDAEIADPAPRPGEYTLITRLCDGRDVVNSKQRASMRLEILCRALDRRRYDLVIILWTGLFSERSEEHT